VFRAPSRANSVFWIVLAVLVGGGSVWITMKWSSIAEEERVAPREPVAPYPEMAEWIDTGRVEGHVRSLSSLATRVTGYPGNRQAFDYVLRQFEEIGLEDLTVDEFDVLSPIVRGATMVLPGGGELRLYPLWPNGPRTCQTPPDGLSGALLYGGKGNLEELEGKVVKDNFILLEWGDGGEWLDVAQLGARALLFLPDPEMLRTSALQKVLTLPADLPRFEVDAASAEELRALARRHPPAAVTLLCDMRWEQVPAWNVFGWLRKPEIRDEEAAGEEIEEASPQPVILEAYYDSASVIPEKAPGAEQACGVATLIELARLFRRHPLDRDLLFLATGAHGEAMAGAVEFVRKRLRGDPAEEIPPMQTPLFITVDVSSGSPRTGLFYKGSFFYQNDFHIRPWYGPLGTAIARYGESIAEAFGKEPDALLVDGVNPTTGKNWATYLLTSVPFSSELATIAGRPGAAFGTTDDMRLRMDTPNDTFDNLRMENVFVQARTLACVLPNLLRSEGKFVVKKPPDFWVTLRGKVLRLDPLTSYVPDKPVPGAFVTLKSYASTKWLTGVRGLRVAVSDASGEFRFHGLGNIGAVGPWYGRPEVEAHLIDPIDGKVVAANDTSSQNVKDYPNIVPLDAGRKDVVIVVFPCRAMTLYGITEPRYFERLWAGQVFDAGTMSPPFAYGYSYPDIYFSQEDEACFTILLEPGTRARIALGLGPVGYSLLLLNASADNPLGKGFLIDTHRTIPFMSHQGAWDMWHLDQDRLETFAGFGVSNARVETLHQRACEHLLRADEHLEAEDYEGAFRETTVAWALESKAYPELLGMANDMLRGVIFYLFLLLPFSYCLERFLLGGATIKRKIAGIFAVFTVSFTVLSMVHPAFRLTLTPLLVLLAFVILALALTVIALVSAKFDRILRERKAATSGVHESDVGRISAASQAFELGIANLRRRRQRTILTCTTLIFVTFTLLSFTSLIPKLSVFHLPYPDGRGTYTGIMYRDRNWAPLGKEIYDAMRRQYSHPVTARVWLYSAMVGNQSFLEVAAGEGERERRATVVALLGLGPREPEFTPVKRTLVAGRWFESPGERGVILSAHTAELLGLGKTDIGTPIRIAGDRFPLIGLIDGDRFTQIEDLDGEELTPVNYLLMAARLMQQDQPDDEDEIIEEYIHLYADEVAVIPLDYAIQLARPRSVAVRFSSPEEALAELKTLIPRTEHTVFAGVRGRSYVYSGVSRTHFSASGGILIPAAIGGLILLSSMLGAVYERKREIGVFNAVGLSPLHVSSLFFAEACVFALLGGIAGYLLGQVVARVIYTYDLLPGVNLNYSSFSTVVVTTFVMLVALASTIYPARQAFRIAFPEDPSLRLQPEYSGGRLHLILPFSASGEEAVGLNAYLHEYLVAHLEASVGEVSTDEIRLRYTDPDRDVIELRFMAWLVPFDLGVSHEARIVTRPSEERAGDCQLTMDCTHASGDRNSWRRVNLHFLKVIRKQFLIWRILSDAEKADYIARGQELLAGEGDYRTTHVGTET